MAHPMGESKQGCLRVDFDRRLKLEFHGSKVTSDAGLLAYRELDDAIELTEMAGDVLADSRTGKNGRHGMVGQFRQVAVGGRVTPLPPPPHRSRRALLTHRAPVEGRT